MQVQINRRETVQLLKASRSRSIMLCLHLHFLIVIDFILWCWNWVEQHIEWTAAKDQWTEVKCWPDHRSKQGKSWSDSVTDTNTNALTPGKSWSRLSKNCAQQWLRQILWYAQLQLCRSRLKWCRAEHNWDINFTIRRNNTFTQTHATANVLSQIAQKS